MSRTLTLKIENFLVWEAPLNHLNLYVRGRSSYSENGVVVKQYEFERSKSDQKLGNVFSTHSMFINEMNKLSEEFTESLTAEIFEKGL